MHLSDHSLRQIDDAYLRSLDPEALCGLSLRLLADLKEARERLNQGPTNSSRPPSSRAPWERGETAAEPDEAAEPAEAPPATVATAGRCSPTMTSWRTRMRAIRTHGGMRRHHHPLLGMNGRFDTVQAAVLLAKWPRFAGEVEARSRIGARYSEKLKDCCATPPVMPGNTHVYAQYTIRLAERERVSEALKAQGIPTAVYYPKCLHEQPVFAALGYRWGDFPEAERAVAGGAEPADASGADRAGTGTGSPSP